MRIHGPMREARIDSRRDDGLDRNQAAMLLITGRTASDSQRAVDRRTRRSAPTSRRWRDVAGQMTRDTVDNLMQPYIDDTFYRLTGLNLRLTVGSDGFQGRVRKRISRRLNLQTDYLQGFQGNSRWTTQVDVWLADYVTLRGPARTDPDVGVAAGRRRRRCPSTATLELRLDYAIGRR